MYKLPQQMKICSVCVELDTMANTKSEKFPITIAEDEVMLLYASKFIPHRAISPMGGFRVGSCLYRKTENVPVAVDFLNHEGEWKDDKAVIDAWFVLGSNLSTAESVSPLNTQYQVYPEPIALIRIPTFLYIGTTGTTASLSLWYRTVKVSDKDLAELMMKDHA